MTCIEKYFLKTISFFKKIDFFAMKPGNRISFKKRQSFSTLIGRIASWLLIGIYLAVFINFGKNMFYKSDPQSIYSQIVSPDPENLNLNKVGFFMAFGLQDLRKNSAHYIDDSIYRVEVVQRTKINGNISSNNIPTGRCQLENVPDRDDLKTYYQRNHIDDLFCIKNDSQINPELKSTWDGEFYKNVLINIYPCINTTDNGNQCKPAEDIQIYLNTANFAIYFNTEAIDPSNFEKPIASYGKQLYTPISFSTLTYIEMSFGHFNFITDVGVLFEDLKIIESANYLSNRQVLSFSSNKVVQIDMKLEKIKTIYARKYDKIQNVLAGLGGIIKALMIFSNLLVLPFIKLNFRLNLANTIFTFKIDKMGQNLLKKVKKEYENPLITNFSSPRSMEKKTQSPSKKFNEKKEQNQRKNEMKEQKAQKINKIISKNDEKIYKSLKTENIQISYSQYFMNCFSNPTSRKAKKMLKKGLSQIDEVLDISYIMKKLVEIDLLKFLLLNENQNNLFEFIPKPIIGLDIEDEDKMGNSLHQRFSMNFSKTQNLKEQRALNSFELIMRQKLKSQIDRKLLNMMNPLKVIRRISFLPNLIPENPLQTDRKKLDETRHGIIFEEHKDKDHTDNRI